MKMTAGDRAHEEHLVRLKQHKKKQRRQLLVLAAECLLLGVCVLAYLGVRYLHDTYQDIWIDPTASEPSYSFVLDPDETAPNTLPHLTEEEPGTQTEESRDPVPDGTTADVAEQTEPEPTEPEAYTNPPPSRVAEYSGYDTYVIFGVDTRKQKELLQYTMGDVCILVSVNKQNGEVRLVSVYRDFCVEGENSYFYKLTSAYSLYGAAETVAILNRNLDLHIQGYVVVGWTALADIVDIMGGLEVNMSRAEAEQVNNYIEEVRQATGRPEGTKGVQVREGTQLLNGVSVVCYSRIRYYVGNDIERTRRQRYVIGQLLDKVKTMNVGQMLEVVNSLRSNMKTTLSVNEIMAKAYNYQKYNITLARSFPEDHVTSEALDWVVFSKDLPKDVKELHRMLYDDYDYTPTENISRINEYHKGRIKGSIQYKD